MDAHPFFDACLAKTSGVLSEDGDHTNTSSSSLLKTCFLLTSNCFIFLSCVYLTWGISLYTANDAQNNPEDSSERSDTSVKISQEQISEQY